MLIIERLLIVVYAEESKVIEVGLYMNKIIVYNNDSIIAANEVLFPFRTTFEKMGATVTWLEETGNIKI